MEPILEIACFNYESALAAQQGAADRIELCVDFAVGGITPDIELFKKVRSNIIIPVYVMIRPRAGNFFYSNEEFIRMKHDILLFQSYNVDGFVFGVLDSDNEIDRSRNEELIKLAHSIPCTFHRAFDSVRNPFQSLEIIIKCGFTRVLTSGLMQSALEGRDCLKKLVRQAGDKIIVMPGGGIRSQNIREIKNYSGANEFHSSAILRNEIADINEIQLLNSSLKNEI